MNRERRRMDKVIEHRWTREVKPSFGAARSVKSQMLIQPNEDIVYAKGELGNSIA